MFVRYLIFFVLLVEVQLFSLPPPNKPSNWDNWKFSQKIIWRGRNLDPRIPYGPLVDKLKVKKIMQNEIPTARVIFATNDPSQIFVEKLPKTFVMKANNASGRGILVKDGIVLATKKRESNFSPTKCTNTFLRSYAEYWLKDLYAKNGEKQYELVKPMIFFEEYLEDITMDIELYFFNGKVRLIALLFNNGYEKKPNVSFYDENWNLFVDIKHPTLVVRTEPIEKPSWIDKLIAFGERFAEKMDHVRIDFFVSKNTIYFCEFTFTTGGGYNMNHLNFMVGNYWNFPHPNDPLVNPYLENLLRRADKRTIMMNISPRFGFVAKFCSL